MQEKRSPDTLQAVERAFQILEEISCRGSMGLNDLHKAMNVSKASLLRLTHTLVDLGYMTKNPQNGQYALTLKMYEVGISSIQNLDKLSLINSTLAELSGLTGRICQFSIEDNNQLLCLQSIGQKSTFFSAYTIVGKRSPLYCTSAGKALISCYSNGQIVEKWDSLHAMAFTEHTITNVQDLLKDIGEVRRRGYALDLEENEYRVFCVGAVVMGCGNVPIGAISISGSSLTQQEEHEIAAVLLPAVQRLSALLGYVSEGSEFK